MAGEKFSDFEVEIAVNQVLQLMIRGYRRRTEILQYISKMNNLSDEKKEKLGWINIDKCDKTIDDYIKRATEKLKEANKESLEDYLSILQARLEDIYRECMRKGKEQTANQVLKNMMYLKGIGGFNIKAKFDHVNFDVALSKEEEQEYQQRMSEFYNKDFILDMTEDK